MKNSTATTTNQKSANLNNNRSHAKESKARKRLYENWQRLEATNKYQRAIAKSAEKHTTARIAEEVLDGIFLNLNRHSQDKSTAKQKRILRRIVEKRQAQAIHQGTKKARSRKEIWAIVSNTSRCIVRLNNLRFAC